MVRLLGRYAIEPDIAAGHSCHAGLPSLEAITLSSHHGARNVEAKEAETLTAFHYRYAGDGRAVAEASILPGFQPSSAAQRAMHCTSSALPTVISNVMVPPLRSGKAGHCPELGQWAAALKARSGGIERLCLPFAGK
jgi:hypothetical protein